LIQLGIKECLIQADDKKADHELTKLKTLVERCNVIVTERRAGELPRALHQRVEQSSSPADFQAKNVEQDLNRLLDESHAGAALRMSQFHLSSTRKETDEQPNLN